jgi:CBS domain containing-hemolysin-like protein
MIENLFLVLVVFILVVLAGLFAGAETGMYHLSRLRLRLGIEQKKLSFVLLGRSLRDSSAMLISMLLGTNLAQYLGTSIVTIVVLNKVGSEHATEIVAMFITVPIFFIFSETIPKNLFYHHSDGLMPVVSPVLYFFDKIFVYSGAVHILRFISKSLARIAGSPLSSEGPFSTIRSSHIKAIAQETSEEGVLSPVQTDIINRLAGISHVRIRSVMTGMSKVQRVDFDSDKESLFKKLKKYEYSWIPVTSGHRENIIGFVNIYECLTSNRDFENLGEFMRPIKRLRADMSVIESINIMQKENEKMALVTRIGYAGGEKPVGIVTMKDLVEELLGELAEW